MKDKNSENQPDGEKARRAGFSLDALLSGLPGFASQTFSRAVGQSGNFLEALLRAPEYMEQVGKAGSYLKDMREVAGLTLDDLAKAVNIENPDLLRSIEEGRSPVTLDILYRLASFYSRNDPATFMINFSREYAPWLWQILRVTGVEKLLITLERELKFINIYRSRESARHLSDEDFDKLLAFVRGGFNMAMDFIEPRESGEAPAAKTAKSGKTSPPKTTIARSPKKPPVTAGKSRAGQAAKPSPRKPPARKTAGVSTRQQKKRTKKEG